MALILALLFALLASTAEAQVATATGATGAAVSVTNTTTGTSMAVRCVTADGATFESCAGAGSGGATDVNLTKYLGVALSTTNAVHVQPGTGASWGVTGTFWQATQPVSGTFWQGTQPVSGTFWQATQPVSGTFWQVTQPVSLADNAARILGQVTFSSAQPVTQSGTWTVQPGNTANTTAWLVKLEQTTTSNDVDVLTLPANASVNVNQANGAAINIGVGAAGTGTLRVATATDSTIGTVSLNSDVRQATAANLNTRADTSGATGAAVPARAEYAGLNDGTNTIGYKAHSAANDAATIITGSSIANPIATWCVNHTPAAATKATISQGAAAAGVRHVITTYSACFAAGATAGPVQTFAIRDGATGAGTVLWSGALAAPVNGAFCTTGALYKVGTAATAATIEFAAAGAATTIETVSMCGYDVQ